jgi:hypothetical protein
MAAQISTCAAIIIFVKVKHRLKSVLLRHGEVVEIDHAVSLGPHADFS